MSGFFGFSNIVEALRGRNYALFAAGNVTALTGFWMQKIGVGWLTWELTESGGWLGVMAFADLFPVVLFAPVAGAITDRWNVLKVIKLAEWLALAQALTTCTLVVTGVITVELLVVLTVLMGFFSALQQPARLAAIPLLVERRHISAASALGAISFNGAQFVGPAIAGVIILQGGVGATFLGNAIAIALFLLTLAGVRLQVGRKSAPPRLKGLLGELAAGVRYAAAHAGIPAALFMVAAIAIFARPFIELFPGFAAAVFGAGASGLAILSSCVGLGAVSCGLWLARREGPEGLIALMVRSFAVVAVALGVFVATESLWVAAPAAFVAGFCIAAIGVGTQILLQTAVDSEMRGRVMSLYVVLFRAMPAIGALTMGLASEHWGLRVPVGVGGVLVLATFAWVRPRQPRMAHALEGRTGSTP